MANFGATKMSMTVVLVIVFSVLFLSSEAQAAARRLGNVGADFGAQLKKATSLEGSNPNYLHRFYEGIKRKVPTGPNPIHNPTVPPLDPSLHRFYEGIKRKVPTGPNPIHNPGVPPLDPSLHRFYEGIKRKVPTGPNPIHNPTVPPLDPSLHRFYEGIKRKVPTGPNPIHNPGVPPLDPSA